MFRTLSQISEGAGLYGGSGKAAADAIVNRFFFVHYLQLSCSCARIHSLPEHRSFTFISI
jgi:hypothetical protein